MEAKEIIYRNRTRRILGPLNGLLALGFGSAVVSGLDQSYLLSTSEAVAALGFGYEAFNNIKSATRDGRGYIASALGSIATVINSPVVGAWEFEYHGLIGNVGIGPSIIFGAVTLGRKRRTGR